MADESGMNSGGGDEATGGEPRALCHATGMIYWMAGMVLTFGTCCLWWPASGCRDKVTPEGLNQAGVEKVGGAGEGAGPHIGAAGRGADWDQRLWMGAVCVTFSGGLALLPLGMALQFDRLRRGALLLIVPGAAAIYSLAYLVFSMVKRTGPMPIAVAAVLSLLWGGLFLLGGASAAELQRHPPPKPQERPWSADEEAAVRKAASRRGPGGTSR